MDFELEQPRTIGELLADTWELYRARPLLYLTTAFIVAAPFEILMSAWDPSLLSLTAESSVTADFVYNVGSFGLVIPLITAAHVFAVMDLASGGNPTVGSILKSALPVLPAVAGTVVLATLAMMGGFVLLIIPGIYLTVLLWFSAQAAAVERTGPIGALRRSAQLVEGRWWSTLGITFLISLALFVVTAIVGMPIYLAGLALDEPLVALAGVIVLDTLAYSLGALTSTLLFFTWRATRLPEAETV